MNAAAWASAGRILCVRLDSMGDVLMTTPAIRAIRENVPGAHIALLTSPAGGAIAALVPELDETIVYHAPWMKSDVGSAQDDAAMIARLAVMRFDAAIIFTVFSQNPLPASLFCRLANIPLVLAHSRERAYALLSNEVADPEPGAGIRHEVQRQLDLVATLGWRPSSERLSISVPESARAAVRRLIPRAPWAVLHPGASAASRRYPHFGEVAARLKRDHGWTLLVTGGGNEAELAGTIPGRNLSSELSLPELAALIGEAPVLIANNSGPAHIAAAVGTPVVDLYALTNPQHTPWQVPSTVLSHDVPCRWCYKSVCPQGHQHCLSLVEPEAVVRAALDLVRRPIAA